MVPSRSWHERGVVETSASPFARLAPVPVRAVRLREGFWQPRLAANVQAGLPGMYELMDEHRVIAAFRRLYGAASGPRPRLPWTDSDLYKWIEGACFVLQSQDASQLAALLEQAIAAILPAQRPDGYLDTYFVDERFPERYARFEGNNTLYCAGHLFQAAVAHHRTTGDERLLACARRFADHLCDVLPTLPGAYTDHPEIEMALVELYRETGEKRYLGLARRLLDARDFAGMQKIAGHAVRATYFCCGGADYFAETGDPAFRASLDRQWRNLLETKLYVTGGVGGRYRGESVGKDYELPNAGAYAETCAAAGLIFWSWRMLALEGDAQYADVMERALYNGFLSGVSLDGTRYFYVNPLRFDGQPELDPWYPAYGSNRLERVPWFDCTCCPTNIERLLPSLAGYFYGTSQDGVWVHLYDNNEVSWRLADGTPFRLTQSTRYPWDGDVALTVTPASSHLFTLWLRIPAWADRAVVQVNGRPINLEVVPGRYLALERVWDPGDRVELRLGMEAHAIVSSPRATDNRGSVALQRGPLVYCLEETDNPGVPVLDVMLDPRSVVWAEHQPELLGGVTVLSLSGAVPVEEAPLYAAWRPEAGPVRPVTLKAIPYFAWNNRGIAPMTVWVQQL